MLGDAGSSAENFQSIRDAKCSDNYIKSNGDGLRSGSSSNAGGSAEFSGNLVQFETNAQDEGSGKIHESESGEDGGGAMDVGGSCKNSVDGEPIENVQGSAKNVKVTGH